VLDQEERGVGNGEHLDHLGYGLAHAYCDDAGEDCGDYQTTWARESKGFADAIENIVADKTREYNKLPYIVSKELFRMTLQRVGDIQRFENVSIACYATYQYYSALK
jgi:hypothetical protein